jgi:hypothetical protein
MGKKLLVSLAMEGKFSSEGLQSINDEDDILMAMARELVTEKGIGESADAVWATLQKKQDDAIGTRKPEEMEVPAERAVTEIPLVERTVTLVDEWSALKSAVDLPRRKGSRRSNSATPDGQLVLF